ncbi:unnamed protein product [Linum tenue]|uniref:Uncharacterized protein n=1 Tax=Linum tenue TaxID=586396 RepID=A0AAV0HF88_9ROSI|nr:unnamed protein product [Linum tenue]CAI0384696.1 unnamed protein product [Linum tenue]
MAGIIQKIGEKLHMGGGAEQHKDTKDEKQHSGDAHKQQGEHKEGIIDKIKDKLPGGGGDHKETAGTHDGEKKKKKNKDKKKDKKDHDGGHDSSSSSDSD